MNVKWIEFFFFALVISCMICGCFTGQSQFPLEFWPDFDFSADEIHFWHISPNLNQGLVP